MKLVKSFAAAAVVLTGTIAQADAEKTQIDDYYTIKVGEHSTAYVFTNAAEGATCSLTLDKDLVLTRALLVGGGGGGGSGVGGGGGAGGMLELMPNKNLAAGATINFKVGAGGAGGKGYGSQAGTSYRYTAGSTGECTTVTIGGTTYTAFGGGGGGCQYARIDGMDGGSGGGGAGDSPSTKSNGGKGTEGQGNNGGDSGASNMYAAGGGGAGNAGKSGRTDGANNVYTYGGAGGDGKISDITGEEVWYAGGGGGSGCAWDRSTNPRANTPGSGGKGGGGTASGGNGSNLPKGYEEYCDTLNRVATPGTDGLGGGGGAGVRYNSADPGNWEYLDGAKGGSGTVILLFSPVRKLSDASLSKGKVTLTLGDAIMENEYLYCAYGTTDGGESIGAWDKVFAITNLADFAKGTYTFAIPVEVGGDDYPFARIFIAGQDSSFAGFKAEQEVVQVAEYATLNGTQFVNTRRLFGGLEDLEIKVMPTEKTQTERTIFWSRYAPSGNYTRALFWWASNNGLRYDYKTKTDNNGTTCSFTDWQKDEEYVFRTEGPQYFVNGDQVMRKNPTYDAQTDFDGAPLFLFAQGTYSSASVTEEEMNKGATAVPAGGFVGRFYYADILDKDDKVIVHYVGAIDPSDNKKKLYDTLSGTFISPKLTPSEKGAEPMGPEAETEFSSLENLSWNVPRATVSVTSALRQNSATVLLIR